MQSERGIKVSSRDTDDRLGVIIIPPTHTPPNYFTLFKLYRVTRGVALSGVNASNYSKPSQLLTDPLKKRWVGYINMDILDWKKCIDVAPACSKRQPF